MYYDYESEEPFDLLVSIAVDFCDYPIDGPIDIAFAINDYIWNGQAELDELIDEIHIGITDPKEVLKFNTIKGMNFTK